LSLETDAGKATVRLVCRTFGLSRAAYYEAKRSDRVVPFERSRKTPSTVTVSDEVLETRVRALVDEFPAFGVRRIHAMLRRESLLVGCRRVWKMMRRLGLTLPAVSEREADPRFGHVAVPEPNRRIGTDLTTVVTRKDGLVAIVPVIDNGCRSALALTATKRQDSVAVLAPVRQALVRAFGEMGRVPDGVELRTDHGPQYTGSDCEAMCREWGLDHTFAPVGRPTGNAVTERFIRSLKEELIWLKDWESLAELQAALDDFRVFYNERRPHQALGYRTPAEYRAEKLGHAAKEDLAA
jgi:putative transposase